MPSFSYARAQTWSRMLSLHLSGVVIQSLIPTKFTPAQPESNMKSVNIKKGVSRVPCSFQAGALLSQQKQF